MVLEPFAHRMHAGEVRSQTLWQIGLELANDPKEPRGGARDLLVEVGGGSGTTFEHRLSMATGNGTLAHAVAAGDLYMSVVNPSGMLTQAYRGTGIFPEALPVRVVASFPSWDQFVFTFHERTGLKSLQQLKAERYPLKLSIRTDPNDGTRTLIDQILAVYDFTVADIESWGGELQTIGSPREKLRMDAIENGGLDAIFDEGVQVWLNQALAGGFKTIDLDEEVFQAIEAIGWRRTTIPAGHYPAMPEEHACIDFSGWPIYTRASLDDDLVYKVCAALGAREDRIPWEAKAYTGLYQLAQDTPATPRDVPLHPGAERWYKEHGYL
jgi:hypothetical protein